MPERMILLGALDLLARCSVNLSSADEDEEEMRELIWQCLTDAQDAGIPIKIKRTLSRIEVEVVSSREVV